MRRVVAIMGRLDGHRRCGNIGGKTKGNSAEEPHQDNQFMFKVEKTISQHGKVLAFSLLKRGVVK